MHHQFELNIHEKETKDVTDVLQRNKKNRRLCHQCPKINICLLRSPSGFFSHQYPINTSIITSILFIQRNVVAHQRRRWNSSWLKQQKSEVERLTEDKLSSLCAIFSHKLKLFSAWVRFLVSSLSVCQPAVQHPQTTMTDCAINAT